MVLDALSNKSKQKQGSGISLGQCYYP